VISGALSHQLGAEDDDEDDGAKEAHDEAEDGAAHAMFGIGGGPAFADVADRDDGDDERDGRGEDDGREEPEIAGGDGPDGASDGEQHSLYGGVAESGLSREGWGKRRRVFHGNSSC